MAKVAKRLAGWAAAAIVNLSTLPAAAEDGKETRWYGWQTLAVDGAAAATMIAGVATAPRPSEGAASLLLPTRLAGEDAPKSTTTLDVGLAMYTLGPAVVHALHGRPLPSIGSAVVRGAGPTVGAFVGLAYGVLLAIPVAIAAPGRRSGQGPDFGKNGDAVIVGGVVSGAVLGALGPMAIDAVALAHEPAPAKEAPSTPPPVVTVQPQLGYTKYGPSVGLAGTF